MKKVQTMALALTALVMVGFASTSFAAYRGQVVNHRQYNENSRIRQGVRNGELTRQEARHLYQSQKQINHYEQVARADGRISPQEYRHIQRMQNRQSQAIYNQKHDNQSRRRYY